MLRRRFLIVPALLGVWLILILARLGHLQIYHHEFLTRQARRQQERTVEVSPIRGVIYDRNGSPLAISVEVDSVFAVPSEISNSRTTAVKLAPILALNIKEVQKKLEGSRSFSWVKRKVTAKEAAKVRQLELPGIYFQKETKRFYPKRELAAHVLGHVGMDDQGLAGIELEYDTLLRGKPGQLLIERDARQRGFRRAGHPPEPGSNLVLTLDENIQHIAEQELAAVVKQSRAVAGSVIVQDPFSGEILALANEPTFNPNRYADFRPAALRNWATNSSYEPGSTFKIITLAAALENNVTSVDEMIDCQLGSIVLAGHTIRDHTPFGLLSVMQIFEKSSDVGTIKLALRVGNDELYRHIRKFGIGEPTGIELPGEARGLTKPPDRWSKISIGAIAMGQEIGVTPLQMVGVASAIANGGWLMKPMIIRTDGTTNASTSQDLNQRRRVISAETAATMQTMMASVVEVGTGKLARPEGYDAGGKTGTAQKIDPETRRYSYTDHVASFVGYAPAVAPQYTILVVLDSPRGIYHGGDIAAPVFKKIAEQILAYKNIPPTVPGKLSIARSTPRTIQPVQEEEIESEPVQLVSLDSGTVAPNFLGQTVRIVTEESLRDRIAVDLVGSGIAYRQMPSPGSALAEGQKIRIWFRVGEKVEKDQRTPNVPRESSPRPVFKSPATDKALTAAAG